MGVFDAVGSAVGDIFGGGVNQPNQSGMGKLAETSLFQQSQQMHDRAAATAQEAAPLFNAFNTGTLTPGQQAELDVAQGQGSAAIEQQAASGGISDSSFAAGQRSKLGLDVASMKDQMLQGDFTQALKALGVSDQEMGMSSKDLNSLLGYDVNQQTLDLETQKANIAHRDKIIGEVGDFAMAGGLMMATGGAAAPVVAGGAAASGMEAGAASSAPAQVQTYDAGTLDSGGGNAAYAQFGN